MPSKISLFKSNRSQASLLQDQRSTPQDSRLYQQSPDASPLHTPLSPPGVSYPHPEEADSYAHLYSPDEARSRQQALPSRSQSQRKPTASCAGTPTVQLIRSPLQPTERPTTVDEDSSSYPQQVSAVAGHKEDHRRSKRSFFGLGSSSSREPARHSFIPPSPQSGLDRRASLRGLAPIPSISTDSQPRPSQSRWPSVSSSTAYPEDEELPSPSERSNALTNSEGPSIPPKDPNRPLQQPLVYQQDPNHGDKKLSQVDTNLGSRQPFEPLEQIERPFQVPAWERVSQPPQQQQQQEQQTQTQQYSHYQAFQPSPSSTVSTWSHQLPPKSGQEFQTSRPPSQQSYEPPSPLPSQQNHIRIPDPSQHQPPPYGPNSMGPPSGPPTQNRQSMSTNQQNAPTGAPREGQNFQGYDQRGPSQLHGSQLDVSNQQSSNHRGGAPQMSPLPPTGGEQGRSTPPPSRSRDELAGLDVSQLLQRHDELQEKYRKVKKYYFDKDAQVQQLQNTLAHQRLSQSRTSLDDNEYSTRFNRLDGAINNLAFNIRKDWRAIPPWLSPHVNKDAPATGTKEMTAVGRAFISRWLVDDILDRYFHPNLDPHLSTQLKVIERNLRRYAPPTDSNEEKDALLAKISNWRLTTVDGLQEVLANPQSAENRVNLTDMLVEKLTKDLITNLKEPAPPGLEGGVSMVVELAVGIAANLPLESRDVFVELVLPGSSVNETFMKVEGALPALTNPGETILSPTAGDTSANNGDMASIESADPDENGSQADRDSMKDGRGPGQMKKKGGIFGINKKAEGPPQRGNGPQQGVQGPQVPGAKEEPRVRFAAFMAVEVRGRSVLVKAPVYT